MQETSLGRNTKIPLLPQDCPDDSHANGWILNLSPATPILEYDQTCSNLDPVQISAHGWARTGGSPGGRQSGNTSVPGLIMISCHSISTDNIAQHFVPCLTHSGVSGYVGTSGMQEYLLHLCTTISEVQFGPGDQIILCSYRTILVPCYLGEYPDSWPAFPY